MYDRAQLVDTFQRKVTKKKKEKLKSWINRQRESMDNDRSSFLSRYNNYLHNWDDFITFIRKGPWEGSSNLHMPLTALMVKTYHSRLYNIFSDEKTAQLRPRSKGDNDLADALNKLRKWYLFDYLNEYRGIRGFVREVFMDCVTAGFGIGMKDFLFKQRKALVIEPQQLKEEVAQMEGQVANQNPEERMQSPEGEVDESRISTAPYKQIEKVLTVYEGSRVRAIPFENVLFPNDIQESNNLDEPPLVIVSTEMDLSDIALKVEQGEWDEEGYEAIKEESFANYEGSRIQETKRKKERLTGYNKLSTHTDSTRLVEYCFCSYDIDEDGINEELIVIRSPKGAFLKVVDLDQISRTGMRPLIKFDCFTKSRQGYSRGVPEYMYPLNEEMDMTHNMRMDYMSLQTCPWGTYRATSSLKNEPIRIAPGKFIPTDDTADLKVMSFSGNAHMLAGEEDRLWGYAERITAVSALSQGQVPDTVGPTRSTSGVVTLLKQMEKEFKVTIDQNAGQWKKLELLLLDDLDRRVHPQVKLRVLGPEFEQHIINTYPQSGGVVNRILSANAQFDVFIDVAEVIRSDEIRRSDAEMVLNKFAAPSLMQQMGVVTPITLYKAAADWLTAFGKDPKDYIEEPEVLPRPVTLWEEIQYIAQGDIPPMSMKDDHQSKIQQLAAFIKSPEYQEAKMKGLYVGYADEIFMRTIQKHAVLLQMLQPKGLPNPSGAQGASPDQMGAGSAPQQGGPSPEKTTSRELPEKTPEKPEAK